MALGHLTVNQSTTAGAVVTKSNATATHGDDFDLDGDTILFIENGDSNPTTATITSYAVAVDGLVTTDKSVTVAAGVTKAVILGDNFKHATTGKAKVVLSNVTTCKVFAVRS